MKLTNDLKEITLSFLPTVLELFEDLSKFEDKILANKYELLTFYYNSSNNNTKNNTKIIYNGYNLPPIIDNFQFGILSHLTPYYFSIKDDLPKNTTVTIIQLISANENASTNIQLNLKQFLTSQNQCTVKVLYLVCNIGINTDTGTDTGTNTDTNITDEIVYKKNSNRSHYLIEILISNAFNI